MKYVSKMRHLVNVGRYRVKKWTVENRHHRVHKQTALKAIHKLELFNGWMLSNEDQKAADEYAVRVFGKKEYAPWLYFYSIVRGGFKEGWIPLNFYSPYVVPDQALERVSGVKTFSKIVLKTEALPDIAYYIDGRFYDWAFFPMPISELRRTVEREYGEVFAKGDNSLRGISIHKLGAENITEETFQQIGNCVIQSPVKQHAFFDEIIDTSTATVRITTVRNLEGGIEFRAAYLKLGRKGRAWYDSNHGIWVPVIDEAGRLDSFCYALGYQQLTAHPDTHVDFINKKIPLFSECVALCTQLHASIPHFPIIGWDVAIDHEESIKVLEWNAGVPHPDICFSEALLGPCFSGLGWEKLKK